MPGTSRSQHKAEAKYNVTTEFPRLDLHFAAASGNLGLVEYALSHGQPINSVLNGVLPLHAACAGGSEVVVKYLIDEGADVNAPRLPRKYSNDRHKSSGLAVGASGSTPLHFAAANGHLAIVQMLLAHGAVPDRADKHGVTPEHLARENGWVQCADVLRAWSGGRTGDLPPVQHRTTGSGGESFTAWERQASTSLSGSLDGSGNESGGSSRRLHVKHSLDNALHLFKSSAARSLHHHGSQSQLRDRERVPPSPTNAHSFSAHAYSHLHPPHMHHLLPHRHSHSASPPTSPIRVNPPQPLTGFESTSSNALSASTSTSTTSADTESNANERPLGEYTFYPTQSAAIPVAMDPAYRRPSLPHIFGTSPSSVNSDSHMRRNGGRRPRSAGQDAEQRHGNGSSTSLTATVSGDSGRSALSSSSTSSFNPNPNSAGSSTASSSSASASTSTLASSGSGTHTGASTPRKLGSKISLRNLFRRAAADAPAGSNVGSNALGTAANGGEPASAPSSYTGSSASASLHQNHQHQRQQQHNHNHNHNHHYQHRHQRMHAAPASTVAHTPQSGAEDDTLEGEIGKADKQKLVNDENENEVDEAVGSGSGSASASSDSESESENAEDGIDVDSDTDASPRIPPPTLLTAARPSILRGHGRSASTQSAGMEDGTATAENIAMSGNSSGPASPSPRARMLRFDAGTATTTEPAAGISSPKESSSPPKSASTSSISAPAGPRMKMRTNSSSSSTARSIMALRMTRSTSSLRHATSFGEDEEDEDEEVDYGMAMPNSSTGLDSIKGVSTPATARFDDSELEMGIDTSTGSRIGNTNAVSIVTSALQPVPPVHDTLRARGASISSTGSGVSAQSSESAATNGTAPSPATAPRTPNALTYDEEPVLASSGSGMLPIQMPTIPLPLPLPLLMPTPGSEKARQESKMDNSAIDVYTADSGESSSEDLSVVTVHGVGNTHNHIRTSPRTAPTDNSNNTKVHPSQIASATTTATTTRATRRRPPPLLATETPLDLRAVSNLAEAEALSARAAREVLASAALPADGPEAPTVSLAAQLAAYGQILALERRFAKGENQREREIENAKTGAGVAQAMGAEESNVAGVSGHALRSGVRAGGVGTLDSRVPQSAKEARMMASQKRREEAAAVRPAALNFGSATLPPLPKSPRNVQSAQRSPRSPRLATMHSASVVGSNMNTGSASPRPPKVRRPHTAEGAATSLWSNADNTVTGDVEEEEGSASPRSKQAHARSTSSPLYVSSLRETNDLDAYTDIEIAQTKPGVRSATNLVSSPKGLQSPTSMSTDSGDATEPHTAPASITSTPRRRASPPRKLPLRPRARTPDPERERPPLSPATADDHHAQAYASAYTPPRASTGISRDNLGYSYGRVGVPLTRVFTAPGAGQYDYGQYSGSAGYGEFGAGAGDDEESLVGGAARPGGSSGSASRVGAEGRRRGSANKLVRMGFAVRDPYGNTPGSSGPGTPNSGSILTSGGGAGGGGVGGVGMLSRSPPKRALGGLRNFVQTLKGKTELK